LAAQQQLNRDAYSLSVTTINVPIRSLKLTPVTPGGHIFPGSKNRYLFPQAGLLTQPHRRGSLLNLSAKVNGHGPRLRFTAAALSETFTPFPILPFRAPGKGTCEYPYILLWYQYNICQLENQCFYHK